MKISNSKDTSENELLKQENAKLLRMLMDAQDKHIQDQRAFSNYLNGMISSSAKSAELEMLFSLSMLSKN